MAYPDIAKTLDMLGGRFIDMITGLNGVATSVSFDLYGCVQAMLSPGLDDNGAPAPQYWFDVARLEQAPQLDLERISAKHAEVYPVLESLGYPAKDIVTGFTGVVTSVSFDLYGMVMLSLNPGVRKDGKIGEQFWFEEPRIKTRGNRVMQPPSFGYDDPAKYQKGPETKSTVFRRV